MNLKPITSQKNGSITQKRNQVPRASINNIVLVLNQKALDELKIDIFSPLYIDYDEDEKIKKTLYLRKAFKFEVDTFSIAKENRLSKRFKMTSKRITNNTDIILPKLATECDIVKVKIGVVDYLKITLPN